MEGQNNKILRIGLLMDALEIPAWAYLMLDRIKHSDYAAIRLIVLNESQETKRNIFSRILDDRNFLLHIAYSRFENRLFKLTPNAFETRCAIKLLANIPTIKVRTKQTKHIHSITDQDIEEIKKYEIDVFIRLGFRIPKGKILESSRFGVWSYRHGDNHLNRGGPAGFWEVLESQPTTESVLQMLTTDLDNGLILYRSYSATDHLLVNRSRNNNYWKTLSFIPRKLKELHQQGEELFFNKIRAENKRLHFDSQRLYSKPRNIELLWLILKHWIRYAKFRINHSIFFEQWILMYDLRDELSTSFWRFKKIVPPKDRFWADPHIIYKDDLYYIFIEEYLYSRGKGRISLLVMDEKGSYGNSIKILERPYHLSYPFVFKWKGDYYMIPESSSNHTIELYRCVEFPNKWEFHKNLMEEVTAFDTTLFHYRTRWWLFTNLKENDGASDWDELFLFFSDDPVSNNWIPHSQNPIVSDVRKARPAGRIFEHNSDIYRPSQNSSKGYGYGIKINQVIKLSETEYEEREIDSIEPNWDTDIVGIHTLAHEQRLNMIDGKLKRFKF